MAGIIRWKDLQNITTTEDQINNLTGLTALAADINRIIGFTGDGADLNLAVATAVTLSAHEGKHLAESHLIVPNSLDGEIISDSTLPENKLSFVPMTDVDDLRIENELDTLSSSLTQASQEIQNLYNIVLPGQAGDIASSINQMISHIEKLEDAHDATAISFGNNYDATEDSINGSSQARVSLSNIRYFQIGDTLVFQDNDNGPETGIINLVNYNTGHFGLDVPLVGSYEVAKSFVIKNISQADTQSGIARSLRSTTDEFTGRLRITQDSTDNAIEILKTGLGYTAKFNNFTSQSDDSFTVELGQNDNNTSFQIQDSDKRVALSVTDQGHTLLNSIGLEDRASTFVGTLETQPLTQNQNYTLPDRSGYVGLGDLTFTELLKVRLIDGTKTFSIAPGYTEDYEGQRVSAWISMEDPSLYGGGVVDLQSSMSGDGELLGLGSQWQIVVPFLDDNDNARLFYGPQEATKQEAIDNYENYIPSAYMKLAKMIVQGDGFAGISQPSIEILEDQRPLLSMGLSAAYYDEYLTFPSGFAAGGVIQLPQNSRGGGGNITYKVGKSQIEVYLDGTYQRESSDFEEYQGEPVAQIRMLKDIPSHSEIRFRITFKAAAVAGGIQTDTLQSVYQNGSIMGLTSLYGPIRISSFDMDTLLEIEGDILLQGLLKEADGIEFDNQVSFPGLNTRNQLYADVNSALIYHQYKAGQEKEVDLLAEIEKAQNAVSVKVYNVSGSAIPKGRGLSLHPSLTNHVVLCDASNSLGTSRLEGVSSENIPSGGSGEMIVVGLFVNAGIALPHGTVLAVNPRVPGEIVDKNSIFFLPEDKYMEVGKMNGSTIIVDIDRTKKGDTSWRTGVAGESFISDVTKIVRFAVFGETRGSFYSATKLNANVDQKFWAIAAVQPSQNVNGGDSISLYKEVELTGTETPFADSDIGLPIYLGDNGEFKTWDQIRNTYQIGDSIIKIGIVEDRRKFIIDSVQQMGTANGPLV